jgi:hypothetical protein
MSKVTVRIDSSRPIFIEADADNFGQVFANMSDEDQVNVLRAMVEHMKPHRIQWDYISIALEKDENRDVRDQLSVILPDLAAKDAEVARLREALEKIIQSDDTGPMVYEIRENGPAQAIGGSYGVFASIAIAALTQPDAKSGGE